MAPLALVHGNPETPAVLTATLVVPGAGAVLAWWRGAMAQIRL
jgi:hypothetical protein